MAFDFSDFNIRAGSNTGAAAQTNRPAVVNNMNNSNTGIYVTPLYGNRLIDNRPPKLDENQYGRPFIKCISPKDNSELCFSRDMLAYGLMSLGAPGTGKTNLFNSIMAALLRTQDESEIVIIFDTKGDYYREFKGIIPDENIIVIGSGDEYREVTSFYNIFREIMERAVDGRLVYTPNSDELAKEIAGQLFRQMKSETQPVFPAMAEQIVAGVIIYFMRAYWVAHPEMLNNEKLAGFLTNCTNDKLKQIFSMDYMKDYSYLISYIEGKNNTTQGVNAYIGTVLGKLFIGPFAKSDPAREFSMKEIIKARKKKVVFIEYDLARGGILSPVYGVLIDRALASALGGRETQRENVYFLLDEMLLLPQLEHLANALNFGRSLGIRLICGLQNVAGLEDIYGEAGVRNALGSFQNFVVFSLNDYETRKFVVDRLGTNYMGISYSPQQGNKTVEREGHTVEEWDILNLGFGEAIVSYRFQKPFIFKMPKYG